MLRDEFPYTARWLVHAQDWSGIEGEAWDETPCDAVLDIIQIAGAVYAPFLAANASAIEEDNDTLSFTAMGRDFTQPVFKYQAKCLLDLRARYAALSDADKARADVWIGENWTHILR